MCRFNTLQTRELATAQTPERIMAKVTGKTIWQWEVID
jgi:hypothetical protein